MESPPVVIDNGSYNMKVGFASDNHPLAIYRNALSRPSYLNGTYGKSFYDVYIGDEAERDEYTVFQPVVRGRIVDWDNMERLWHNTFYKELKVAPEDQSVILTCSPVTDIKEKTKCCEVLFEILNTPEMCIQPTSILALYGSGLTTGMTVDLGYDVTSITPAYEGGCINYAHISTGIAGSHLTEYIARRLSDMGVGICRPDLVKVAEDLKRNVCTISYDGNDNQKLIPYTLPSGEVIDVNEICQSATELLFNPVPVKNSYGYHEPELMPLAKGVVMSGIKVDADIRGEINEGIVVCGGLGMLPGLFERLTQEVEKLMETPFNIFMSDEAYSVAWLGAATYASLPDAKKTWVTKEQFEEHGEKIIKNKFI